MDQFLMFDKDKKYFPIHTETACQKKWNWSSVYLNSGTTNSCHRCGHLKIDYDNFDQFHNLPKKLNDRQLMLKGQWPVGGCEYCMNIEAQGGGSDRQYHLNIPNLTPPELYVDPTAVEVTPQIVEIYLNNTCNLACTYCYPQFSTRIQQEIARYGRFEKDGIIIENDLSQYEGVDQALGFSKFSDWLERNVGKLKRLHIAGGETFYQTELDTVLDILAKKPNPNLELNIISNLMAKKTRYYLGKIKTLCAGRSIGRFDLTASIDCWGPQAEYARWGLDLRVWEDNFAYAVDQKWLKLCVNMVITSMTIKTVPDLLDRINHYRQFREINQQFNMVVDKPYLHPKIFGPVWDEDFARILEKMPTEGGMRQHEREYMNGIKTYLSSTKKDVKLIQGLHAYLDELDRRRNTHWRDLFPYLDVDTENVL